MTIVSGYPQDGGQGSLMDIPRWITPAAALTPHPMGEPFEWEWFDDAEASVLLFYRDGVLVWMVDLGPNATTATVPALPGDIPTENLLGAQAKAQVVGGTLGDYGWERYGRSSWVRYAKSLRTLVSP